MTTVFVYSLLLIMGLLISQTLPIWNPTLSDSLSLSIRLGTMFLLAFIMIRVGYEFDIEKSRLRQYGVDYAVAATAAAFPWIFCAMYFVFAMTDSNQWWNWTTWTESLLAGRFAAPTSAGVLFSMLAAGGLAATWVFKKARVLAIFDDLDTILLMIPLKILIVGWAWQLGIIVLVMAVLLWMAWAFLRRLRLPSTAGAMFLYGAVITTVSEIIYRASKLVNDTVPIHIEVLLPAFVLGCMLWKPKEHGDASHREHDNSETIATVASGVFLLLVGLSMPSLVSAYGPDSLNWPLLIGHTLVLTVLANLGKMFAVFCYRHEAHWRERLAVSIAMWPRGEVGAGVLILSLSYGISGPIVAAAVLSLALNLLCTGLFIVAVKKLTATIPVRTSVPAKTQPGSQIVSGSESLKHFAESRSAESVRLYEKWKRKETS